MIWAGGRDSETHTTKALFIEPEPGELDPCLAIGRLGTT